MAKRNEDYKRALLDMLQCRPVAYYPRLAHVCGGVKAAVLLSQLLYWTGDQTVINRHGWIYKSVQDMQEETGLTKVEQKNARQDLMAKGVLECVLRGVPRIWHYRINMDRLAELLIGKDSHSMSNSFNENLAQWETHSMSNFSNIGEETNPTLGRFVTQLNRNLRLHTETTEKSETTSSSYGTVVDQVEEEEAVSTGETGWDDEPTEEPEEIDEVDQGESLPISDDVYQAIEDLGVFQNLMPEVLQRIQNNGWTDDDVLELIKAVRRTDQTGTPAALFIGRLRRYKRPPRQRTMPVETDSRKYISGQFADWIEH